MRALFAIILKQLTLSLFFFGINPINKKYWEGNPLLTNAVKAAHGPGEQITSILFSRALSIRKTPGSLIEGMPASETKAIEEPPLSSFKM